MFVGWRSISIKSAERQKEIKSKNIVKTEWDRKLFALDFLSFKIFKKRAFTFLFTGGTVRFLTCCFMFSSRIFVSFYWLKNNLAYDIRQGAAVHVADAYKSLDDDVVGALAGRRFIANKKPQEGGNVTCPATGTRRQSPAFHE